MQRKNPYTEFSSHRNRASQKRNLYGTCKDTIEQYRSPIKSPLNGFGLFLRKKKIPFAKSNRKLLKISSSHALRGKFALGIILRTFEVSGRGLISSDSQLSKEINRRFSIGCKPLFFKKPACTPSDFRSVPATQTHNLRLRARIFPKRSKISDLSRFGQPQFL